MLNELLSSYNLIFQQFRLNKTDKYRNEHFVPYLLLHIISEITVRDTTKIPTIPPAIAPRKIIKHIFTYH
jgi:hypothetical protein